MIQSSEDVVLKNNPTPVITLPFDVSSELGQYSKVFITREIDRFRMFHCFDFPYDYRIFGELPDGDKKILFSASKHFQWCDCCDNCSINVCCCEYMCCDRIVFQMDYKKNNKNFYTQGFNVQKGCYFCICTCCCNPNVLYLRENVQPESKDFNIGLKKGKTEGTPGCFSFCRDKTANYTSQEELKGPGLRITCADYWKHRLTSLCCDCFDINVSIENGANAQIGNVTVPGSWCSKKVETPFCYFPGKHFEVNFPSGMSSEEKFNLIACLIHFNIENNLI